MPKITALIHTLNDELRLGRCLDSLRAIDQVIVVDHGSTDKTERVAREHGADFRKGIPDVDRGTYTAEASHDWILCLRANESLSDQLEAVLFEWKENEPGEVAGFNLRVREETNEGWKWKPPETRLVNRTKTKWTGELPSTSATNGLIPGDLLRFDNP